MIEEQKTTIIKPGELLPRVTELYDSGYRLVQIGVTKIPEGLEINYSFDKDLHFFNLRILIASVEEELPSISEVYWSAFLYENEIHDLFGIQIKGIAVDYHGNFYRTTIKTPFNIPKVEGEGK